MASWRKDKDPILALSRLKGIYKLNKRGEVEYTSYLYDDYVEVLLGSLEHSPIIPNNEARGILRRAVAAGLKKGNIAPNSLIATVSRMEAEYLALPVRRFFLFGCISLNSKDRITKIAFPEHTIIFREDIPSAISRKESEFRRIFLQAEQREFPSGYLRYAVSSSARSESEAGNIALDVIDYHRALWNLPLNSSSGWRFSTWRRPINKIMLGPLHVLFTEDYQLIESQWWHDPSYKGPVALYDISQIWGDLRRYERRVLARLDGQPSREFVLNALVRYVRALDGHDYESVYLKLWSLLEHLTLTERNNYDVTIRRASFIWKDASIHRQILNVLRDDRNRAVHSDKFSDHRGEALIYQLKRYIEALLNFLVLEGDKFKNLNELKQFLDLSTNLDALIARQRLTKWGIKLRSLRKGKAVPQ